MPTESRRERSRVQSWARDDAWRRTQAEPSSERSDALDENDPAFRYGYESASRYVGRDWDEVEPELRRRWTQYEHRGDTPWDEIKHSVREGYRRASEDDIEP